jgi:alpha-N-arabinofuranosidase
MVFLAVRPNLGLWHHLGRETFLAPVRWDPDGWPVVADNGRVALDMDAELPESHAWPKSGPRDDFDEAILHPCWNFLRNPNPEDWSLSERDSYLTLRGSEVTLDELASPAFVGRRQQHFECRAATLLEFSPNRPEEEAGLTALMNENHHYEIALTLRKGRPSIVVRCRIGFLGKEIAISPAPEGPVELRISADRDRYGFSFAPDGGGHEQIATAPTRYLSKEVAGGFTGVYVGMYATGNGRPCREPAHFDWFDYAFPD